MSAFADDSSDDEGSFLPTLKAASSLTDIEEDITGATLDRTQAAAVTLMEYLFLQRDADMLERLRQNPLIRGSPLASEAVEIAIMMLQGKHMEIISKHLLAGNHCLSINKVTSLITSSDPKDKQKESPITTLQNIIKSHLEGGFRASRCEGRWEAFKCLLIGVLYLELYQQINYTGPELSASSIETILPENVSNIVNTKVSHLLEVDGEYSFVICQCLHLLFAARIILGSMSKPFRPSYKDGIVLDEHGDVVLRRANPTLPPTLTQEEKDSELLLTKGCLHSLPARHWFSARATIVHLRSLQRHRYEDIPSLFKEACDAFNDVLCVYGGLRQPFNISVGNNTINGVRKLQADDVDVNLKCLWLPPAEQTLLARDVVDSYIRDNLARSLAGQAWLEWGLCFHHFGYKDRGRLAYGKAKECTGLTTTLTGGMGKRTKYQQTEHAMMYLQASSVLTSVERQRTICSDYKLVPKSKLSPEEEGQKEAEGGGSSWEHAEWELGRRVVDEVEGGEEAAVREVMLDSQDGGARENILFEGGPRFSDPLTNKGNTLHPVDQAVVLSLCLDVSNNNAADGLTNEEMFPYIERVLLTHQNWMIHSTALLERSWLEFEKRRTMDRAMMQIQALLDQHTTRLTLTQSTYKSVEESAPPQDRLMYINCIVYPAQYGLKKDLAHRYLTSCVFASALNYFRELQLWDEVVKCYQLMDKPHRAELVVREQLKNGETPYMLTALGDLTSSADCYERAWELSGHRYCRAKRTLARLHFDKGDFQACCEHMDAALAVMPLVPAAWYLKGIASMRLEVWDQALEAFVRCVQQDTELFEAWANMGAIHMKNRQYEKALNSLQEALRHQRDSWKVLENLMAVAIILAKFRDAITYMGMLLDLRHKSKRPYHKDELVIIVEHVTDLVLIHDLRRARAAAAASGATEAAERNNDTHTDDIETLSADANTLDHEISNALLPDTGRALELLLQKIMQTCHNEPDMWGVCAGFYSRLRRHRESLECLVKLFRGLLGQAGWEKDEQAVALVAERAHALLEAHTSLKDVTRADMYACRSLLQSALRGSEEVHKDSEHRGALQRLLQRADDTYAAL